MRIKLKKIFRFLFKMLVFRHNRFNHINKNAENFSSCPRNPTPPPNKKFDHFVRLWKVGQEENFSALPNRWTVCLIEFFF